MVDLNFVMTNAWIVNHGKRPAWDYEIAYGTIGTIPDWTRQKRLEPRPNLPLFYSHDVSTTR